MIKIFLILCGIAAVGFVVLLVLAAIVAISPRSYFKKPI